MAFSVVDGLTFQFATALWQQRRMFYAAGLWWLVYADGTDHVYRTSSDNGYSWSAPTVLRAGLGGAMGAISVWFDGTYLHYAVGAGGIRIDYRRGQPSSNGTITWSAVEQLALLLVLPNQAYYPTITVDANGTPWIGFVHWDGVATYSPWITKASTNDGTWVTDAGFPFQLNVAGAVAMSIIPVPLTGGNVYIVYGWNAATVRGRLWNGAMQAEEVISTNTLWGFRLSAISYGDDVVAVFVHNTGLAHRLLYIYRTGGVWGAEQQLGVDDATLETAAVLSVASDGQLYAVATQQNLNRVLLWQARVENAGYATPNWTLPHVIADQTGAQYAAIVQSDYNNAVYFCWLVNQSGGLFGLRVFLFDLPRPEVLTVKTL